MTQRERALSRRVSRLCAAAIVAASLTDGACFPETKSLVAGATYEAQQLACVDNNETRETIDRCRMAVKRAWSSSDAGAGVDAFVRVVAFDNGLVDGGRADGAP